MYFVYIIWVFLYLYYSIYFSDFLLCDSGENTGDFINTTDASNVENDNNTHIVPIVPKPKLLDRIRCKITWKISGQFSELYTSYEDYKKSWDSSTIWGKIKSDFIRSRNIENRVLPDRGLSDGEKLMRDIRSSRNQANISRQRRINDMFRRR